MDIIKAPAKINLTLDVTGKRSDGYHELKMIMQTVSVYDELMISLIPHTASKDPITLKMNRELPDKIPPEKNIVYKAAMLMKKNFSISMDFEIYLKKISLLRLGLLVEAPTVLLHLLR